MRARLTTSTVIALAVAMLALSGGNAWAGDGDNGGSGSTATGTSGGGSGNGTISASTGSRVTISGNYHGGGAPLASSDASYAPPACWYEPRFTPEQYQKYYEASLVGWDTGKQYIAGQYEKLEKEKFNEGKKGMWWQIEYNQSMPGFTALDTCPYQDDTVWVPQGDPTPPPGALTALELSRIAYSATRLPAPPVRLSPSPAHQIVNLPTYVKFGAPLDRVWVTAGFDAYGIDLAATTVATPVALHVDAGTADADPRSCSYDLTKSGGGYRVDSSGASCDITYRRSSDGSTYPLRAQITWRVVWTASRNPDGPARQPGLPDGLSTFRSGVTVKEIQTVVR